MRIHDYAGYIRNVWWADYDSTDTELPRMICMNCRLKLINHNDPIDNNPEPQPSRIKYELIVIRPETRQARQCDCDICLAGRFTFKEVTPLPVSRIMSGRKRPKHQKRKRDKETESVSRCTKCHQVIGRGIKHPCNRSNKQVNHDDLVRSTSDKSKSKVIAGIADPILAS